jgi:hypothetical protein
LKANQKEAQRPFFYLPKRRTYVYKDKKDILPCPYSTPSTGRTKLTAKTALALFSLEVVQKGFFPNKLY